MKNIKKDNKKKGGWAEGTAARYLEQKGHQIIERNYAQWTGEIDIISKDQQTVVFTEVKYRKELTHGTPGQAVSYAKQRHIIRTALLYLQDHQLFESNIRFDVVEVLRREDGKAMIRHIPDAFQADRSF
ncbi:MAG: YraN family protein [Eubacteriaceae bacterium]|jgi:putative endonuclease|nr:YraN family protein [Eubacteriaceae bacterium]MDD4507888.1 YraN family protein [Eubacteriaceae bacterium]